MTNTPPISSEWVERGKSGDPAAIEAILRAIHPLVRNVCRGMLNDEADAEDATQNALINVVRNIDRFDGRSSFTTWVYRIATNAAIDEARRRQRRRLRMVDDQHDVVDESHTASLDQVD
ncbi:MAG: hypothetical protein RLZ19_663, partial [Actinomycetota bacterium]